MKNYTRTKNNYLCEIIVNYSKFSMVTHTNDPWRNIKVRSIINLPLMFYKSANF